MFKKIRRFEKIIRQKAILRDKSRGPGRGKYKWVFDFRLVLLSPLGLELATEIMAQKIINDHKKNEKFCLGCLTLAPDPLVGSLIFHLQKTYKKPINGFIIRKQKKPRGLQKIIEGNLRPKNNVVLIDDLINTGSSLKKAAQIVQKAGGRVKKIYVITDFRKDLKRNFFAKKGIQIKSIFRLEDFGLNLSNLSWQTKTGKNLKGPVWTYGPLNIRDRPLFRSAPKAFKNRIFIGSDSGLFSCFDFSTGVLNWQFPTPPSLKGILSTPAIIAGNPCFGDYNGFVYLLSGSSGEVIWKKRISHCVGSSPAANKDKSLIFVGTEYGPRPDQSGGLTCLYAKTGRIKWAFRREKYVHSSPCYSPVHDLVFIGSNSGKIYCVQAQTGQIKWETKTRGGASGEIKFKPVLSPAESKVFFGSHDSYLYCLRAKTGFPVWSFKTGGGIRYNPLVLKGLIFFGSDDGYFYCLKSRTGRLKWRTKLKAELIGGAAYFKKRIFAADTRGFIFILDYRSGKIINQLATKDRFFAAPLVYKNKLLIGNKLFQCWDALNLIK
ncbi:MAG: PQQ-binding-like beta-propeller repeat protein [Patescibacteria group bacterium]|nr:PQQ-binding-like beta-propeller repeat protein [Patescibacteria group bacterium]